MKSLKTGIAAAILLAAVGAHAQTAAPALKVHPIKEGKLYWVEGGGGNSGVIIGDKGVVVIDAKTTADAGRQLVAEVAKLTPKPITHVVITHSDGDHVNGLAGFPDGLKIIAHENNKIEQQSVFLYAAVEVDGGKCLPPKNRMPNLLIRQDRVVTSIDGVKFDFRYYGPAHTGGDLVIYLPDEKLAFTGDLITSSVLTHPEKNGSFDGWFKAAQGLLALPADRYVGGHATDLDTKDSLRKRVAAYQATRDKVDTLVAAGKSLTEVKAAMGDPAKDASGCRGIPYPSLSEVEFNSRVNKDQELK
jgi:glyoxylase-like metal-dependent hydrolase (beta-lactamase superfamily II)